MPNWFLDKTCKKGWGGGNFISYLTIDQVTHSIKTSTNIQLPLQNELNNWQQVGFLIQTYKTKHYVGFFVRPCKTKYTTDGSLFLRDLKKSQHKYMVLNSSWKLSAIINKREGGRGVKKNVLCQKKSTN